LLASIDGAAKEGASGLVVRLPGGRSDDYVDHQIIFTLR
jgi:hypothetical protein